MVRNASTNVIGISSRNPHYFQYKGKDILLITSAEHYGAVVNKAFDYKRYLDALAAYGLNYTRIYPGAFILPTNAIRKNDILSPGADFIAPWARSDTPGYIGGGNKFDLEQWDPAFFERLEDFLRYAAEKDIIVEICLFNCQYSNSYPYSPFHKDANVQGVGGDDCIAFQTLSDKQLVAEQLKFIEKLIVETNSFDNVIYEFIDEPTIHGTSSPDAYNWISVLIDHAVAVEEKLPKKHLLAQQLMLGVDFSGDDRIALNVSQYVEDRGQQVGGVGALANTYHHQKPIELNETVSVLSEPNYYERDIVESSRLESWEFMVGGGAGFNQLNACFNVENPAGDHPINHAILASLRNLRSFLESMEYIKMVLDPKTIRAMSIGGRISGIYEAGKQYAFYIHHSFTNFGRWRATHYLPNFGEYQPVLTVCMDPGEYLVTFINPADLGVISSQEIVSDGGEMEIACPLYTLDLAVKITAK